MLAVVPALPTIALANEFFDNIPVRQFVKSAAGWRETLVDFKNGDLVLALGEQTQALPPDALEPEILQLKEGLLGLVCWAGILFSKKKV